MNYKTRFQTIEFRQGLHQLSYTGVNRIKLIPDAVAISSGARFDGARLMSEGITYDAPDENGFMDQAFTLEIPAGAGFVVVQLRYCEATSSGNQIPRR